MEAKLNLNNIGQYAYNELRKSNVIPDKDKKDLTLTERKDIINTLHKCILQCVKRYDDDIHKSGFMLFFYSSVLNYIDNTDLNKYISLTVNNNTEQ